MRRSGCGCLLIIFSLFALFAVVVIPVIPQTENNATVDNYIASLLCKNGETVERELYQSTDFEGTSYSMNVFCQPNDGQRRDVTGAWVLYGIAGFAVPFTVGLILFIFGLVGRARRGVSDLAGSLISSSGSGFSVSADSLGGTIFTQRLPQAHQPQGDETLAHKLKELQEARDTGLITSLEYDRLRQELLDKWT